MSIIRISYSFWIVTKLILCRNFARHLIKKLQKRTIFELIILWIIISGLLFLLAFIPKTFFATVEQPFHNHKFNSTTKLVKIGEFNDGGISHDIFITESLVYVADDSKGLEIINVTDPTTPSKIGKFGDGGAAYGVFVSGSYAYVADYSDGLEIIDIQDLYNPQKIGAYFPSSGEANEIFVKNDLAYLADGSAGIRVINISNPAFLVEIGQYENNSHSRGVFVQGSLAYIADNINGLDIVNISDPYNLYRVGQYSEWDSSGLVTHARCVIVDGSTAFVTAGGYGGGLEIVNISNPTKPTRIGGFYDGGVAEGVAKNESYVFVADGYEGLEVLDISAYLPSCDEDWSPTKAFQYNDGGYAEAVWIQGPYIYVADGEDGLEILQLVSTSTLSTTFDNTSKEKPIGFNILILLGTIVLIVGVRRQKKK